MAQMVESNVKTFELSATVAIYRRVKLDSNGKVLQSGAGEPWIGTCEEAGVDTNHRGVRLITATGTRKMVAAGALSISDILYGAADGKVDDAPTGEPIGTALEAATADGDIIEVLPVEGTLSQAAGEAVEVIGGAGGITALDLVYVSDQTGDIMTVLKAQGTSGGRFAEYICPNAIAAAAKGAALKHFLLSGINTNAQTVGDPVYLSDAAAGEYTYTKPTATDKVQQVGEVVEKSATTGAILFDLTGPTQIVHTHADNAEGGATLGAHTQNGNLTFADAKNIIVDTTTGTKIGTAAAQKLGLWNATPVVQQSHVADASQTQDAMTDSTGGSANTELVAMAATGADALNAAEAAKANDNFADIAAQLAKIKTDVAALVTAVAAINAKDAATGLTAAS